MFFLGVFFRDSDIRQLFDLSRILLDPEFARPSHITLRGPYKRKKDISSTWLGKEIEPVILLRPSNFFNEQQNTVYIRADFLGIGDIWYKPDYPHGVPHLSIYDGGDRTLAWQTLLVLRKFSWRLRLNVSPMSIIDSKQRLETKFIRDFRDLDAALSSVSNKRYSVEAIKSMHVGQRLHLLEDICRRIHEISLPSKAI